MNLDDLSYNKKAVIAYTDLGQHHDMEISRKKGILYFNIDESLGFKFAKNETDKKRHVIETGDLVRIVSNGEQGFVFNLSRE